MIDLSSIDVSAFQHWLSPGGEVLLINADCMAVLPLLPKVDAVVTDPPYGVGFDYASYDDDPNKHAERCTRWVEAFKLATAGPICVFCGIRQIWMWPQSHWILSWRKTFSVSASPFGSNNWEPVLVYQKGRRGERELNFSVK